MTLSNYGFMCFKLQSGDTVVAIDPFGKGGELTPPRFETHIAIFTDSGAKKTLSLGGAPTLFETPGEYEMRGISFVGFHTTSTAIPFYIEAEGIKVLALGPATKEQDLEGALDHIDAVDILLVSSAGTPKDTQTLISSIDPRIVIIASPEQAKKGAAEALAKEVGEKPEKLDKLSIKQKNLPTEGQRVIILERE